MLGTHHTTVTMVTRPRGDSVAKACDEGMGGGCEEVTDDGVEWETLRLQLSREDLSRDVELESLIITDLAVRHKDYLST